MENCAFVCVVHGWFNVVSINFGWPDGFPTSATDKVFKVHCAHTLGWAKCANAMKWMRHRFHDLPARTSSTIERESALHLANSHLHLIHFTSTQPVPCTHPNKSHEKSTSTYYLLPLFFAVRFDSVLLVTLFFYGFSVFVCDVCCVRRFFGLFCFLFCFPPCCKVVHRLEIYKCREFDLVWFVVLNCL